jgi:hypothetical protein
MVAGSLHSRLLGGKCLITQIYLLPRAFRIILAFAAITFSFIAPKSYTSTSPQAGQGNSCRSSVVKATSNTLPHLKQRIVIGIGKCHSIMRSAA